MSDMRPQKNKFHPTLYKHTLLWYNKEDIMIPAKFSNKQEDMICRDPEEEHAEAVAPVAEASEAEASEAEDMAAVDTAAADLGEAREDLTAPEDRVLVGALALDLDGALVPVITVADALAA